MDEVTRLRRSELAVPGTSQKMIAKAAVSGADLVFLDLEDSVAPDAKAGARALVAASLRDLEWHGKIRACRINAVGSPWFLDDLREVVEGAGAHLDVVIVPKVNTARDVWFVDETLSHLERKAGLEDGRIGLEVLIEEASALMNVDAIAAASSRLRALILGVGDLAASQGVPGAHVGAAPKTEGSSNRSSDIWEYARQRVVVAARANGLEPVDGPYADYGDSEGYMRLATTFAAIGGTGKWCIHPSQIDLANQAFSPTDDEVAQAREVVSVVREAEAEGFGAVGIDGVMFDAATARIFERTLSRARLCEEAAGRRNGWTSTA